MGIAAAAAVLGYLAVGAWAALRLRRAAALLGWPVLVPRRVRELRSREPENSGPGRVVPPGTPVWRAFEDAPPDPAPENARSIESILDETFAEIPTPDEDGSRLPGIPTGFHELDALLRGLRPGCLTVVAGRPSMGKTSLVLSIVERVALEQAKPVLLFTPSCAASETARQMLCSRAGVDGHPLRAGRLGEEDYQRLLLAAGALHEARILVDDDADLPLPELRARCDRLVPAGRIALVAVDGVRLDRDADVSLLKSLARDLRVPVLATAPLGRRPEHREDHRPLLADLRDAASLEDAADAVVLLYREEYYDPASGRRGICELNVAKNRGGPAGVLELAFLARFMRFENLAGPGSGMLPCRWS